MPTRKIADLRSFQSCRHPDHHPPSHCWFPNGLYEHTCPACGYTQRFRVDHPTLGIAACPTPYLEVPAVPSPYLSGGTALAHRQRRGGKARLSGMRNAPRMNPNQRIVGGFDDLLGPGRIP